MTDDRAAEHRPGLGSPAAGTAAQATWHRPPAHRAVAPEPRVAPEPETRCISRLGAGQPLTPERLAQFFAPREHRGRRGVDRPRPGRGSYWQRRGRHRVHRRPDPGASRAPAPCSAGRPSPACATWPKPADLAFIMVPTDAVEDVLDDAGAAGVRGRDRARRPATGRPARRAARSSGGWPPSRSSHGITLLGPNCLGFLNAHAKAGPFALTVPLPLRAGPVGIAMQSGALASVMLSFARSSVDRRQHARHARQRGDDHRVRRDRLPDRRRGHARHLPVPRADRRPGRVRRRCWPGRPRGQADRRAQGRVERRSAARRRWPTPARSPGDDAVVDAVLRQLNVIRVTSIEELLTTGALLGYGRGRPAAGWAC